MKYENDYSVCSKAKVIRRGPRQHVKILVWGNISNLISIENLRISIVVLKKQQPSNVFLSK